MGKIDERLDAAQSVGDLKFLNRAYREYRLEAQRQGRTFMPYPVALSRLRKALASAAAGARPAELVAQVFGDARVSARVKTARCPARASPEEARR